jgi:membrane-associated phospholipid phosphatase
MLRSVNLNYKNLKLATAVSFLLALLILALSFTFGKYEFFLLLNANLGVFSDYFFEYFTILGDGLLWVVWLIIIFKTKKREVLPLILSSFVLTTFFTQILKHLVITHRARPSIAINNISDVHLVEGVTVYALNSFPSGHTATAFTFVLLIALLVNRFVIIEAAIIIALLVGYSRIYLGQHFPLDVGAGILVAICSVHLAIPFQNWFTRKMEKQSATTLQENA